MVDETTVTSLIDSGKQLHVVRSHRRPPSHIGSFLSLIIIGSTAALIATSAIPLERAVKRPVSPVVAAPLALPIPEPVRAPVVVSEPQAATSGVVRPERTRVTRTERPQPKTLPKIETVIAFALAQQGDRYSWAAAGPNAYDCSGLVLAAFATVGIKLPHYTGTMVNYGKRVGSKALLQRGDMVFPSSGHVGIYLGDNKMVHASSSKGKVSIGTVYSFYTARRLL